MTERLETGIPGVDVVLKGGMIAGRSYLLVGSPGTGKTIFGLQWLLHGHERSEEGLFVSLAEPTGDVADNIRSFGWNLDGIAITDLTPTTVDVHNGQAEDYRIFLASEVERVPYWKRIYEALEKHKPVRFVLDSLTQLRYAAADDYQFRQNVLQLVAYLSRNKCTALFLYEPIELKDDATVALAVDGIYHLRTDISPGRAVGLRYFQVEKMRGSDFLYGLHPLQISDDGLRVFPHIVERNGPTRPAERIFSSGVEQLDQLLEGGLESGTTTLISGPSGVGKSTVATLFVRHSILSQRELSVYYSFEESQESLVTRCRGVGIDITELLESGLLAFYHINPLELYPDQFLDRVRRDVEDGGRRLVVVDSLAGYEIAMEEFGKPVAHMHNLTTYRNRKGVTTLLSNTSETIAGPLKASELGMSHLADNILLLRYAEVNGRIIKVVGCLKKRVGHFKSELRELLIEPAPKGVQVGPVLEDLEGLLTGGAHQLVAQAP